MASKLLEASAVVFLLFASFAVLSSLGKAVPPAQYHAPAEIYPQGSGSGLDADTLDAKHASAFITSETDPTVAASVKDGVSWGEVGGRPSYSCGAANQGLKTIDLNTGAVSCETDDVGVGGGIPSGAVMFFNLASCPSGWTELTSARGRYVVGLPSGGTLAGTDGTALTNLEDRPTGQHTHPIYTAGGNGYSCKGLRTVADAYCPWTSWTTNYIQSAGSVAGTNAPYIQLLACQKS